MFLINNYSQIPIYNPSSFLLANIRGLTGLLSLLGILNYSTLPRDDPVCDLGRLKLTKFVMLHNQLFQ